MLSKMQTLEKICFVCGQRITDKTYITCKWNGCHKKFHLLCIGQSNVPPKFRKSWYCSQCQDIYQEQMKLKTEAKEQKQAEMVRAQRVKQARLAQQLQLEEQIYNAQEMQQALQGFYDRQLHHRPQFYQAQQVRQQQGSQSLVSVQQTQPAKNVPMSLQEQQELQEQQAYEARKAFQAAEALQALQVEQVQKAHFAKLIQEEQQQAQQQQAQVATMHLKQLPSRQRREMSLNFESSSRQAGYFARRLDFFGLYEPCLSNHFKRVSKVMRIGNYVGLPLEFKDITATCLVNNPHKNILSPTNVVLRVAFNKRVKKYEFLQAIRRCAPIYNKSVAISGERPPNNSEIHVYECLNAEDQKIFDLATQRCKQFNYEYCWTEDGITFIKKSNIGPDFHKIDSLDSLAKIITSKPQNNTN